MEDFKEEAADHLSQKDGWQSVFFQERPLHVLLVEDDHSTRQVVSAILSECGYEVSTATDGANAWVLLEGSGCKYDLVLADALTPLLPGFDLLSKIVKSEAYGDIPVIMMSSQDSMDVVLKCLRKGAKDFLVKPLRRNELRNLWQHVWRRNFVWNDRPAHVSKRRKIALSLEPAVPSDFATQDIPPSDDSLKVVLQQACGTGQLQVQGEDSVVDQHAMIGTCAGNPTHKGDAWGILEGIEASERSAKAMDLIGTMMAEPAKVERVFGSRKIRMVNSPASCLDSSLPSVLELSLKRSVSVEAECIAFDATKDTAVMFCLNIISNVSAGVPPFRLSTLVMTALVQYPFPVVTVRQPHHPFWLFQLRG